MACKTVDTGVEYRTGIVSLGTSVGIPPSSYKAFAYRASVQSPNIDVVELTVQFAQYLEYEYKKMGVLLKTADVKAD